MVDYVQKGNRHELAKPILGQDGNGEMNFALIDAATKSLSAISIDHLLAHDEKAFSFSYVASAVADAASAELLLITPATPEVHFIVYVRASGDSSVNLYEGADAVAGTAITPVNRKRASALTAVTTASHTPTVTTDGTLIYQDVVFASTSVLATGGGDGGFDNEFILKPSTKYLLRITNTSGSAATIVAQPRWLEV